MIDFIVNGIPAPGGSKSVYPVRRRNGSLVIVNRGGLDFPVLRVADDSKGNKAWKAAVATAARIAYGSGPPLADQALRLVAEFRMPRPKAHYIAGDPRRGLKPQFVHAEPKTRPDLTKLTRSTEDAMLGIVYAEDGAVTEQETWKRYANPGERPGARIKLTAPKRFNQPKPPAGLFQEAAVG